MKIFLIFAIIGATAAAPHIVGGRPTNITEVPYQLELDHYKFINWGFTCGAAVIGPRLVITAGHCVEDQYNDTMRLRAGSTMREEGKIYLVDKVILHPNYTVSSDGIPDNDIGLVITREPFEYDEATQPINLTSFEPEAGETALISGWGALYEGGGSPLDLRSVEIPIVDREECNTAYEGRISPGMFCAGDPEGGKDSCQGDSGGPVVVNKVLAGVVSWGHGCAEPNYPGVYTNVARYLDWIAEQQKLLK